MCSLIFYLLFSKVIDTPDLGGSAMEGVKKKELGKLITIKIFVVKPF